MRCSNPNTNPPVRRSRGRGGATVAATHRALFSRAHWHWRACLTAGPSWDRCCVYFWHVREAAPFSVERLTLPPVLLLHPDLCREAVWEVLHCGAGVCGLVLLRLHEWLHLCPFKVPTLHRSTPSSHSIIPTMWQNGMRSWLISSHTDQNPIQLLSTAGFILWVRADIYTSQTEHEPGLKCV